MKTVKFNEDFLLEISAYGNNRSAYDDKLRGIGLDFERIQIDANTDKFIIKATMSKIFIGQLNDFLNQ